MKVIARKLDGAVKPPESSWNAWKIVCVVKLAIWIRLDQLVRTHSTAIPKSQLIVVMFVLPQENAVLSLVF